ncbi:heavy metal-associated domain-containing protein, partial [Stenotrophomonas sp. PS02297]|uniref:heavy-metal-associated domain-containing protein n=1 Tax=Stenotrophomonas sp. PS02297 TaxID=2991423 RepID=UPI0031F3041C
MMGSFMMPPSWTNPGEPAMSQNSQNRVDAGGTTQEFPVEGMTCASCVGRVERALAAVPGVASA